MFHWILLIFSAILHHIPFIYSGLWGLIFLFPLPLLYLGLIQQLSFMQGFIWGFILFSLHLYEGICMVSRLSGEYAALGFAMGFCIVVYQALFPGILFYGTTRFIKRFSIAIPFIRISIWVFSLLILIWWIDQCSLSLFGIREGYPLMHPLIVLAHRPYLLFLLPILGKQLMTILFMMVSASLVLVFWYRNIRAVFFCIVICSVWLLSGLLEYKKKLVIDWHHRIKSLPCMAYSTGRDPRTTMNLMGRYIRNILQDYPETTLIIMPESALNIMNFEHKSELLDLWHDKYIGKPIHIVFGTCRLHNDKYYNTVYWVYNGVLQAYYDKKHAMLMTERLTDWMDYDCMRGIYFKEGISISCSCNERMVLRVSDDIAFIPYVCSEFFFTEYPDDCYNNIPIIVMVNDTLLHGTYVNKLLLLLARFKAIQWQRVIVYVSYARSVIIDKHGMIRHVNE